MSDPLHQSGFLSLLQALVLLSLLAVSVMSGTMVYKGYQYWKDSPAVWRSLSQSAALVEKITSSNFSKSNPMFSDSRIMYEGFEKSLSAKREKIANIIGNINTLTARLEALYTPGGPGKRFDTTAAKELESRIMEQVRWVRNRIDIIESDVKALDDALHACSEKAG